MNEFLYYIENRWGNVIAKDLNINTAMILVRALFDKYCIEGDISYTVKRQKENIEQPGTAHLYAISQTSKSGEVYYRDFKNCVWKKTFDESCLCFEKHLIENSWKGDYKLLTFDLSLREEE